jgi:hypothetical protein
MSKIHYEITAYENGNPVAGFDISPNQMDMIGLALCDYQDIIFDEDSPYYDEYDASDFSELQSNLNCL